MASYRIIGEAGIVMANIDHQSKCSYNIITLNILKAFANAPKVSISKWLVGSSNIKQLGLKDHTETCNNIEV